MGVAAGTGENINARDAARSLHLEGIAERRVVCPSVRNLAVAFLTGTPGFAPLFVSGANGATFRKMATGVLAGWSAVT